MRNSSWVLQRQCICNKGFLVVVRHFVFFLRYSPFNLLHDQLRVSCGKCWLRGKVLNKQVLQVKLYCEVECARV